MPLIYITGPAGTGKSALTLSLRQRGYAAYDEDDPAIGSAHNLETGLPVKIPAAADRDADWFSRHEWRIMDKSWDTLQSEARNTIVFLFGNSVKGDDIWRLFDKVFYLAVDESVLRQRIGARTDNDYGKDPDELLAILARKQSLDDQYKDSQAIIIDTNQPLEHVADDLLMQSLPPDRAAKRLQKPTT